MTKGHEIKKVFVTGGTGFLAGWVIRELLEDGYQVKTSVRAMKKSQNVIKMLEKEGVSTENLSFAVADLSSKDGWKEAMTGCDYVIHTASSLGGDNMDDPSLIPVAVEGADHVISAAIEAKVKKIVMTSSEAASYPDKKDSNQNVKEDFWTDENNKYVTKYMISKLEAEKHAWKLIHQQSYTKMATILPGAIMGPAMGGRHSSTDLIFESILKGQPAPKVIYPVGDVRDLARLHILAMESEKADGERFFGESEEMTMPEMANVLRAAYPDYKISKVVIPDFVISLMAHFNPAMKVLNTMTGLKYHRDQGKAKRLLGWNPRSAKETVKDQVAYLMKNNLMDL